MWDSNLVRCTGVEPNLIVVSLQGGGTVPSPPLGVGSSISCVCSVVVALVTVRTSLDVLPLLFRRLWLFRPAKRFRALLVNPRVKGRVV